jgi:hypothetical protein
MGSADAEIWLVKLWLQDRHTGGKVLRAVASGVPEHGARPDRIGIVTGFPLGIRA